MFLEKLSWFSGLGLRLLLAVVNLLVLRPCAGGELCSGWRLLALRLGSGLREECRIIESLRLENTSKIESNHHLNTTMPAEPRVYEKMGRSQVLRR